MAETSGVFEFVGTPKQYDIRCKLYWKLVSQSVENNTVDIEWKTYLYLGENSSIQDKYAATHVFPTITIGDVTNTYRPATRLNLVPNGDERWNYTATYTVTREADGTLPFSINLTLSDYNGKYEDVTISGSGTADIPMMPGESYNYKTYSRESLGITADFSWSIVEQSIENNTTTIEWSINTSTIKHESTNLWRAVIRAGTVKNNYTYNSGDVYLTFSKSQGNSYSGQFTVAHAADGTSKLYLDICIDAPRVNPSLNPGYEDLVNATYIYTLRQIEQMARLTEAPNFNDEENPTITYSNYTSNIIQSLQVCISLTGGEDDVPYRDVPTNSTSYTFELTDEERATLRRAFTTQETTRTIRFYVKSVIDGVTYWNFLERTLTLINYLPTLAPVVRDINALTVSLTGDNKKFIKFFSNALFENGATAHKEATIVEQSVVCGSTRIDDSNTGTVLGMDSNIFYFRVKDSRGFVASQYMILDTVAYTKPTCNIKALSLSSAGVLSFTISGNYFNSSFGAKNNSLEFECGYRKDGGDITWRPFVASPTITNNTYTVSGTLSGFDYQSIYTVVFNIIDELSNAQSPARAVGSISVYDWGKTDFRHNTDVYLTQSKTFKTENTSGTDIEVINPCTDNNDLRIGYGNYTENTGSTSIYGADLNLTGNTVNINGRAFGENKVLWSGASHMNGEQSITLSESVSSQVSGIVLVFSGYDTSTTQAKDASINTFFVSKKQVELFPSVGHTFILGINAEFSGMAAKYLYFTDTTITGHAGNTSSGTNSGISYNNSNYVLRYVIGV